jgi:hypothetical protein
MTRAAFDAKLKSMLLNRVGDFDLCGGPITTTAKQIPSTLKIIERDGKSPILSLRYFVIKEGQGLDLDGRVYHYIAIFRRPE